ncbi:HAMP domain-containing sensor histidine kinase [Fulvivirgaceae bacterium BMA10]|uniref:histidine kinase n=1 Tax=Splendidivirga corallicola TaxID=3051826 RepID=A0ABT8KXZ2_9BACT|nr:HAMP domain-containing sensor histidine kinase [Fulvivirgaceae bacterium BMA10]
MRTIWFRLINIGVQQDLNFSERRRVRTVNFSCIVAVFVGLFYVAKHAIQGNYITSLIDLLFTILILPLFYLNHKKKYVLARYLFILVGDAFILLLATKLSPGTMIEYFNLVFMIIPLLFFKSPRVIFFFYIVSVILFFTPQIFFHVYSNDIYSFSNQLVLLISFFLIVWYFQTEQEKYARFVSKQNRRLQRLNEEKNQLIGIAAHDLKSPLKRIEGLISIIKLSSENLTPDQHDLLEKVSQVSNQQNEMIMKVLDLEAVENRMNNSDLVAENLVEILNETLETFHPLALEKDIKIHTNIPKTVCYVKGQRNYLMQVLENLLSNAFKFSPPDTNIYISIDKTSLKTRISVRDEGPGLSQEDMKKLFGKFQKLSAKPTAGESSSGLGLAIAKKYVEAMFGNIWCESDNETGATFIVELQSAEITNPV